MTPTERLHLEIYGYVVVEDVLTPAECSAMLDAVFAIEEVLHANAVALSFCCSPSPVVGVSKGMEIKRQQINRIGIGQALHASADPASWLPHPASHMQGRSREGFRVDNLPHLCKPFFDFVTHPRIRGFGEEACGGPVRLGQSDAHIHRGKRDFSKAQPAQRARLEREGGYGFHGGYGGKFAPQIHTTENGLTHCAFMKCLTNLTDLTCPEDVRVQSIFSFSAFRRFPRCCLRCFLRLPCAYERCDHCLSSSFTAFHRGSAAAITGRHLRHRRVA